MSTQRHLPQFRGSLIAALAALLVGIGLHWLAIYLRDYGPSGSGWSLRGNGATIVLLLWLAATVTAVELCAQRRLWIGLVLAPIALFAGVFVVFGSF
jgi:hypothetical protein